MQAAFKFYLTNPLLRCALFKPTGELQSLLNFMESNKIEQAIVTSIEKRGKKQLEKVALQFIPTAVYAYKVGHNTLKKRKQEIGL
ncbi:MAG: hypothetical protein Q7J05_07565 [Paludibacter sp.]|nr:hypothetical protein [Paludibacter sp.]